MDYHYHGWQIIISITQNEVTINYVWGAYRNEDEITFHIDRRQNQSGWETIRPLLSQTFDGYGLDISKLDLSAVAACHIWFDDEDDHDFLSKWEEPMSLPLGEWRLRLTMENGQRIQGWLGVGSPEGQAFGESLVSYITHPNILGFNLEEGQYSPVRDKEDVKRLAKEIHDALQARKEELEESQGDGPKLPENYY